MIVNADLPKNVLNPGINIQLSRELRVGWKSHENHLGAG